MDEANKNLIADQLSTMLGGLGDVQAYIEQYESAPEPGLLLEGTLSFTQVERLTEAIIVRSGRPGLLIQNGTFQSSASWQNLAAVASVLNPCFASVGRIEAQAGDRVWTIGTGWVFNNHIITNRHVAAELFQLSPVGTGNYLPVWRDSGRRITNGAPDIVPIKAFIDFGGEAGGSVSSAGRFELKAPIHLPDETAPDLAVLTVHSRSATGASLPSSLTLSAAAIAAQQPIAVVGYPAEVSDRNPDPQLLHAFFQGQIGVKRLQPGFTTAVSATQIEHDCTTTGGNSGSPLLDIQTGEVVGVHYSGEFMLRNRAVAVEELRRVLHKLGLL
ncbi:trypsin-like serine peptidase [Hymenobacter daeguensis]